MSVVNNEEKKSQDHEWWRTGMRWTAALGLEVMLCGMCPPAPCSCVADQIPSPLWGRPEQRDGREEEIMFGTNHVPRKQNLRPMTPSKLPGDRTTWRTRLEPAAGPFRASEALGALRTLNFSSNHIFTGQCGQLSQLLCPLGGGACIVGIANHIVHLRR